MHVITAASADEELIYQLTKTMWENRADIAARHGAGKAINEKNAARYTGTEFHPGAIRFYKEAGIWPESEGSNDAASGETASVETEASEEAAPNEKPAKSEE